MINLEKELKRIKKALHVIELLEDLEKRIECSKKQLVTPSVFYTKKEIEEKLETQLKMKERLFSFYIKTKNTI